MAQRKGMRADGLYQKTAHTFRHNYATMLYYNGIKPKEAQRLLGHSSIKITLELYTHLSDLERDDAAILKGLAL